MADDANTAFRELGIIFFLACVGLGAGGKFVETRQLGLSITRLCQRLSAHHGDADPRRADRGVMVVLKRGEPRAFDFGEEFAVGGLHELLGPFFANFLIGHGALRFGKVAKV